MNRLKQLTATKKRRWMLSIGITFTLYVIVFLTLDITYATSDDSRIMYALAGYASGSSYPKQSFINYFLGVLIGLFYQCFPQIPWYAVYHIVAMFISECVIFLCFCRICDAKKLSPLVPFGVQIFCFLFLFLLPTVSIQFTVTSTILGTSAVVAMASLSHSNNRKTKYVTYIYCFIALLFSFMTRTLSWYSIMCFFVLACLYQLITLYFFYPKGTKRMKKSCTIRITLMVVLVVCSCFGLRVLSLHIKNQSEITQLYNDYNDVRIQYMDYKQRSPYAGNEKLYESIGWDNELYRATLCLLYMDPRINEEALTTITEAYQATADKTPINALSNIKQLFDDYLFVKITIIGTVLLFLFLNFKNFRLSDKRKQLLYLTMSIFCCGGCSLLLLYLGYTGRLPLRSYQSIVLPCVSLMIVFYLKCQNNKHRQYSKAVFLVAVLLSLNSLYCVYIDQSYSTTQTETGVTYKQFQVFEEFAVENQDNFYVYDFSIGTVSRNPFVTYPNEKPINTMISGGSYTFSELYYEQLHANGLESMYWEDLLKKNVYFVSANAEYVNVVQQNIENLTSNDIKCETIKQFGENTSGAITIYKFSKLK